MSTNRYSFSAFPPVVKYLLIFNVLVFLLQQSYANYLLLNFALWPVAPEAIAAFTPPFELWQLVSYAFLHGDVFHLLLNMYALWMFGIALENYWGSKKFAIYFFVCAIGAGLVQISVAGLSAYQPIPTIGASGGVFGILLAYGMCFPNQILYLIIPPMPIKAKWFVVLFGAIELLFGITGTFASVAHFAHLGGMLFGFLLIYYWNLKPPQRP